MVRCAFKGVFSWILVFGIIQGHCLEPSDVLVHSMLGGKVQLRPSFQILQHFDDNILFQQNDPEDDFQAVLNPAITLDVGNSGTRIHFALKYDFQSLHYLDNDRFDSENHRVSLTSGFKGGKLSVSGTDSLGFLTDLQRRATNEDFQTDQIGLNVDRIVLSDNYRVNYQMTEKTSFYVNGRFSSIDYDETPNSSYIDVNTWTVANGVSYQAFSKASIFTQVHYGQSATNPNSSRQPKGPHLSSLGGSIGLDGDITPRLTGTVQVGYETREYSDDEVPAPDEPTVNLNLNYRFGAKTSLGLILSRRSIVSASTPGQSLIVNGLTININRAIGSSGKLFATLGATLEKDDYEETTRYPDRADDDFRVYFDLIYNPREWINTGFGYEYIDYSTDQVRAQEYSVNRVTLFFGVGY